MNTPAPTLCHTLAELADETWAVMSLGLARTDMREPDERTFTDHHFLHLERRHRPHVRMWLFSSSDEALTGGDVEWWVGDGSSYIRMLIQAKRLNRKARYSKAGVDIGKTGVRQVDRLVEICERGMPSLPRGTRYVGLTPVYLFYNGPLAGVTPAPDRCKNPSVDIKQRGCTIVHAKSVQTLLGPARWRGRRYVTQAQVAPSALPWRCLLCCPQHTGAPAARIAAALRLSASEGRREVTTSDDGPFVRMWPRGELPVDPEVASADTAGLMEAATEGWRPGGRLLVITTVPPG
jgi:hypothetical protein